MKRRFVIMALATAMAAAFLTGCGDNEENKESSTDAPTATPTIEAEQVGNNDSENIITARPITGEADIEEGYSEQYLDEPNWEKIYKEEAIPKYKLSYDVKKFVFEDMTRRFKNKEEIAPTEGAHIYKIANNEAIPSFVCDVANIIPEDTDMYIYNRECYKEFAGFDAQRTEILKISEDNKTFYVNIYANDVEVDGNFVSPMWVSTVIGLNEDGTFFYKNVTAGFDIEPTNVEN